ncbi:branched-chain amino acid ABC transporter permease [Leadbettera azotonutricia]|uniref:High-affinity branched chain amino acid ABC transporter, permease protein n=1 Tax=Leadbettera azotonutricia (strain ATCC BAA-888 / DSM 13862 / ZAS-9) TaxID=545695 RepID=F5YFY3_LEAAZ|nr:branched-chain amino acid ABC transporter permease [Leadbettera azotonutricia]AEF82529.1 high-affinity branched chain amino acid ABC transporter, permease protein [Leadbettera azotonutricia ZAS-9]
MQQLNSNTKKPLTIIIVIIAAMVLLTALASFGVLNPYVQSVLISVGINIIFASSLNIVNGYMGEFSCGHAGFMAVGAYVSSVLSLICFNENKFTGSALFPPQVSFIIFPVIVLIGGIAAAIMGLIIAIPSFKTRDDYLAIITLAANYIIVTAINNLEPIGGSRGLMGMKGTIFAMTDTIPIAWMFLWVMIFVLVCIVAIRRLMGSVLGKGISTIRYDEISAEIMSVNTNKMKLLAFMFSSGLAGIGGALFAHQLGFINPASFNIMKSTEGMVMVYLGGMGSLTGSVFAAILFTFLLEAMRPLQIFKWVVIPLLLILLMQFRPEGLMGNKELPQLIDKFKARKANKGRQ